MARRDDGERLLAEGRVGEALMAAETALARGRDAASLHARALAAIQAMEPAFATLQLAAAIHTDQAKAQLDLGHAYLARDDFANALRSFRRTVDLAPASAEAHASLGLAHHRTGDKANAERHSRRALSLDKVEMVASQTLAAILEARGEAEAARDLMEHAYSRQSLFTQAAADARLRVLVLATTSAGNVPYKALMPATLYTRLVWYMEHARETETPAPSDYDVVFNTIGDADLAPPSRPSVDRFLSGCPKAVINAPAQVALTRRDLTPDRLGSVIDVVVPRTVLLTAGEIAASGLHTLTADHGLAAPVLVRPIGSHGGAGLRRVETAQALDDLKVEPNLDHYVTAYVDYRSTDGLYRKYRMIYVDRRPFPYHQAIASGWLVHHESAGMDDFVERRGEEARFLTDPESAVGPRAMAALHRIGAMLDLDYAGIDFSVLPDGRVLVFEANATMLVHREDPTGPYAHKNPHIEAICDAFQALLARRAG